MGTPFSDPILQIPRTLSPLSPLSDCLVPRVDPSAPIADLSSNQQDDLLKNSSSEHSVVDILENMHRSNPRSKELLWKRSVAKLGRTSRGKPADNISE